MGLEEDRQIAYSLEKIATCAELLTQILNDNREAVNLMFESTKEKLKEEEHKKELAKDRPPEGDVKILINL